MKIFWFDTETTGLDPKLHDILQLAFLIEIDGKIIAKHNFNIQPCNYTNITKEALEINGLTIKKIKTFEKPREVYLKLIKILDTYVDKYNKKDKFHPAGYNIASLDVPILKQFFLKNENQYYGSYFDYHLIDPISTLALFEYKGILALEDFKLATASKHFKIKIDAHKAMSDIEATRELALKLLERIK